jgi:hypothetical protein
MRPIARRRPLFDSRRQPARASIIVQIERKNKDFLAGEGGALPLAPEKRDLAAFLQVL